MTIEIGVLVVQEDTPSGYVNSNPTMVNWVWFKPSTHQWFKHNGEWEEIPLPDQFTNGYFSGNVNIEGELSAGGLRGLTGQKTIAGYTFSFKEGLLVGFSTP